MTAGVSSDYAAQRELMDNLADALRPVARDAFAGIPVDVFVAEPPVAPRLGIVVQLQRDFDRDVLPITVAAERDALMSACKATWLRTVPFTPLEWQYLAPPSARYHGFVAFIEATAPKPIYPSIVIAKAVLRPTAWLRKRLGLQTEEK